MIERIRLQHWRTHQDTVLEFSKGTNVLIGKSGAGKTSVMDGICFGLFGTFPALQRKELSADQVIMTKPHTVDFAAVELEFKHNNNVYKVERWIHKTKTPQAKLYENQRLIAGPKVTEVTDRIQSILELDYDLFSRAIYSEQNQLDYFLKLSAQQRKQKFDAMLQLDKYESARASAVKVKNRLKVIREDRGQRIQEMQARFSPSALLDLEYKIQAQTQHWEQQVLERAHIEHELQVLSEQLIHLTSQSKQFEQLNTQLLQFKAQVHSLENELKSKDLSHITSDAIADQLQSIQSQIKQLEKNSLHWAVQESELKNAIEQLQSTDKQIAYQQSKLPKYISSMADWKTQTMELEQSIAHLVQRKQSLEQNTRQTEKEFVQVREQIKVFESKIAEENQLIQQLEHAQANCPVCKRSLETSQKRSIAIDSKNHLQVLSAELLKLKHTSQELKTRVEKHHTDLNALQSEELKLHSTLAQLKEFQTILKDLPELNQYALQLRDQVTQLTASVKSNNASDVSKQLTAARVQEKELQELQRLFVKQAELMNVHARISSVESKLTQLNFNPAQLDSARMQAEQKKERVRSLTQEAQTIQQLILEFRERLKELNEQKKSLDLLSESVQDLQKAEDTLIVFTNALLETQSELRMHLVDTINQAMADLWPRVYPYSDYNNLRLHILDGSYELRVQSRNGSWLSLEGILSGGEKSTAALITRISLSLVLAYNLNWLILDEPTHNLDAATVNRLSLLMREHLPELVDQIFLITHDKEMENAASGCLYILERDKDNDGITKPELKQG